VLRGRGGSNASPLPDQTGSEGRHGEWKSGGSPPQRHVHPWACRPDGDAGVPARPGGREEVAPVRVRPLPAHLVPVGGSTKPPRRGGGGTVRGREEQRGPPASGYRDSPRSGARPEGG